MNIANWLAATARLSPAAPALIRGTAVEADYATFAQRAAALGRALLAAGVAPGDRVALFMHNCTEYLECLYGIWWAGAAAIPINAKLHPREAAWICSDAGARIAFVDGDTAPALAGLSAEMPRGIRLVEIGSADFVRMRDGEGGVAAPAVRSVDDLAWLFYTSGTTGRPKGVMLSNGNLIAMSLCYLADVDEVAPDDAILYAAPMSHGAGLYNFIHVRRGCRHVVPPSGGFDADEVLTLASQTGSVSMFAAPTMVQRLVAAARSRGESGEGIKTIVYGGGPMYLEDIRSAIAVMGQRFVQIYGQGESPMTITALSRAHHADAAHPRHLARLASVGAAQSAVSVRVTAADGRVCAAGEVGEVEVKGPPVMLGYWNNPQATAETLVDGWLRTGDVGRLDEDGFLTLSDRSKDVIISGGTNIYPREVEEVLLAHPSVREVSVIGVPDPEWGESVVAYVVCGEGEVLDPTALDAHCLSHIARFKRPKRYVQLVELPKNNYGKVLKTALRALASQETPPS